MSTYNIGFYEDLTKTIFQISSNTHVMSSSAAKGADQTAHWPWLICTFMLFTCSINMAHFNLYLFLS